jgi:hypothetical protein
MAAPLQTQQFSRYTKSPPVPNSVVLAAHTIHHRWWQHLFSTNSATKNAPSWRRALAKIHGLTSAGVVATAATSATATAAAAAIAAATIAMATNEGTRGRSCNNAEKHPSRRRRRCKSVCAGARALSCENMPTKKIAKNKIRLRQGRRGWHSGRGARC